MSSLRKSRLRKKVRGGPSRNNLKIQRMNSRLNKLLAGVEKKHYDITAVSLSPTSTTGSVLILSDVDEGDSNVTREGEKITHTSSRFRGEVTINEASAPVPTSTLIRIMLVKQKTNATPALNGVLAVGNIYAPLNKSFRKLVTVVYDRTFVVDKNRPTVKLDIRYNQSFQIEYSGALGTDLARNGFYMLAISDQAALVPTIQGYFRMNFTDL